MKGLTHFQKFVVFENDNGQPFIGVWGVAKIVGSARNNCQSDISKTLRRAAASPGTSSPRFLVRGGGFPPCASAERYGSAALRRTLARTLARAPGTLNETKL